MKIWLDDERPAPKDYICIKTAQEAIILLKTNQVTHISLDHDLGTDDTGYTVALFIEQAAYNKTLQPLRVAVHTQNTVGRKNICMAIQNAYKYWSENL